jgi:hypothetical protein
MIRTKGIFTAKQAVVQYCRQCIGTDQEVIVCKGDRTKGSEPCTLYPYRLGTRRPNLTLIRKFCLSCCSGSVKAVAECTSLTCPFQPFRYGYLPSGIIERNLPETSPHRMRRTK